MDNTENFPTPVGPATTSKPALFSDNRNVLIMLLSLLLLLSVLGVTFINTLFDIVKRGVGVLVSFFGSILGTVFYASGDILNTTTNTVADVAKTSIDLGSGAINDVGNLMKSGVTGDQPPMVPIAPVVVHTAGPTPMVTGAPALPRTARPALMTGRRGAASSRPMRSSSTRSAFACERCW